MRQLTDIEIEQLVSRQCTASDWSSIFVTTLFVVENVKNVDFIGEVHIGDNCTLKNVTIANCRIGRKCEIRNVHNILSGYTICDEVTIVNCGTIKSDEESTFGIATEVAVVNEAGGREVLLSQHLTSNIAYMIASHRCNKELIAGYDRLVTQEADAIRGKATIGSQTKIENVKSILGVCIGANAVLSGCSELIDGTIKSSAEQPTHVGTDVKAEHFVLAEGSDVDGGATLKSVFVGHCAQVGDGFFAENCLVFCNSQLFNGEGVSAFAGPFTVSHHKTSLLIASYYSFFNAGSATNASNHHYRLGPSHQAVLERGVKTGSGSYILEPAYVGAYSMVVGHHKGHPNTSLFPFSYIIERNGDSYLMIGQNLRNIGIYRDEEKWKSRDRRKQMTFTDKLTVDVFNPWTIQKMIEAIDVMNNLYESTAGDVVLYEGVRIQKAMLPRAIKAYGQVVEAYVGLEFLSSMVNANSDSLLHNYKWVDCGGLVMTLPDMRQIEQNISEGKYQSVQEVCSEFDNYAYEEKTSAWCREIARDKYGWTSESSKEEVLAIAKKVVAFWTDQMKAYESDAAKDFGGRLSVGYGLDGDPEDAKREYIELKGESGTNTSVLRCRAFCESKMKVAKELISSFEGSNE